ncbi:MAG: ATP-binding cassette domain-containing protein, partial [Nanoarchaeota archaeon]
MSRIAIVDNTKLKDIALKIHIKNLCPVNRAGKDCINVMNDGRLTIDESLCTGCGICVKASPDAIKIINLPEELIQIPIHRYGENKFVLYNLPTLLFERVTGILGVNGIGKSTAIKILAGVLKPNLGDYKRKKIDYRDIINLFKGTPTQRFFEDVINGKIRVSYKPQQVDLIPKTVKGRVGELLRKIDERGEVDTVVKQLQLKEILKNDITEISGGELQRVAIAGCVLKKANLYIFDEPTSYLDIKQRINISRFIKSLVTAKTAILVVEHDLIILDYIADLVNIMYGKEDCYGIVSGVKPVKNGINTYLTGYIREENVRFRDSKIRFEQKPPVKKRNNNEVIISWNDIEKKLGTFMLNSNKGN